MTEWGKLQSGLVYDDFSEELFALRVRAKKLFRACSTRSPTPIASASPKANMHRVHVFRMTLALAHEGGTCRREAVKPPSQSRAVANACTNISYNKKLAHALEYDLDKKRGVGIMKKTRAIAVLFAIALAFSLFPQAAFAQLGLSASPHGEETPTWLQEASDVLGDSYLQVKIASLYENGKLLVPDGISATVVETDSYSGLLLSGPSDKMRSAQVALSDKLEFAAGKPVGRVSIDALAGAGSSASVSVRVDGAGGPAGPIARFRLDEQAGPGKAPWQSGGAKTQDVYGSEAVSAGSHAVTLTVEAEPKEASGSASASVLLRSIEFSQSSLPVIYLDLDDDAEKMMTSADHSVKCAGSLDLQIPAGYVYEHTGQTASGATKERFDLEYIRGRGNSTWNDQHSKKPYKLKFKDKQDLFGMGASKHWVLIANAFDKTLAKDRMTAWLGQRLDMEFTPQCVPVEVVMNGVYQGSYLLSEQVRVESERVNIDELKLNSFDEGIQSGGYLLSARPYPKDPEEDKFNTSRGFYLLNKTPSVEDAGSEDQIANLRRYDAFIRAYMQRTEDALFGEGFKDANGRSYEAFMDVDSLVKYWWVQEFSRNGDAYNTGSTYLYKKRDGKLFWGPLWDFDIAWDKDPDPDEGGDYTLSSLLGNTREVWIDQVKGDPAFRKKITDCWEAPDGIKAALALTAKDGGLLDAYYDETRVSWIYDKERWLYGNDDPAAAEGESEEGGAGPADPDGDSGTAFRSLIDDLKAGINARISHIDGHIDEIDSISCAVTFMLAGEKVETIYTPKGRELNYLPKLSDRDGYLLGDWHTPNGEKVYQGSPVSEDMTLEADYIPLDQIIQAKNIYFKAKHVYVPASEQTYMSAYELVPFSVEDRFVAWSSSDEAIATVDEMGEVTCKKPGTATITATLRNGTTGSYDITFTDYGRESYPEVATLSFPLAKLELACDEYAQVLPDAQPNGTVFYESISYESSDVEVASVDEFGVVRAIAFGTTQIVARYSTEEKELEASFTVVVGDPAANADKTSPGTAKATNPLKVKGKVIKVRAGKLKRKTVKLKASRAFKVTKNVSKTKISYKKTRGASKVKVVSNGKVTLKKGLKRGAHKVKVKVVQKAGATYKAKTIKGVVFKVIVK